ncbi:MAG TPA: alpha/beta hydrolase, partial [Anaerolineae bacterium]|nr:alpha/beta hydrolase [Anaerolineae bacterium]
GELGAGCLLYFHGGGYATGSTASHRAVAGHVAAAAGRRALSVGYRLAPEWPFPAAVDDGVAAYEWLLAEGYEPAQIVFVGDSAGAGLLLSILLALREQGRPMPAGAVCLSPMADMTGSGESLVTRAEADPWFVPEMLTMLAHYVGDHEPSDPMLSPVFADLTGLPPLLFHVGSDEILHSDTMRLVAAAEWAGVEVTVKEWAGMWHGFHYFVPLVPESRAAVAAVGEWIRGKL